MRQRVGRFFREWFRLILAGDDWSDRFLRWFVYVVAIGLSFLTAPIDITLRAFGHGPGMIEAPVGLVIVIVGLCLWIAVSAGIATRVAEELTLANPIFIGCETVPWRPLQNSLRSWCRFEVRNNGLRSPLRVRLMGVRPALQINGMGGPLEPMMSASSPTGEVTIDQGESQKFDLFMMIRWKFRMPRRMVRESGDPKNPKLIQWGPRRRSQYLVLLLDNEEVEPSTPRYEFDVRAHAGSVVRDATFEVCLTPRGPLIRKLAG